MSTDIPYSAAYLEDEWFHQCYVFCDEPVSPEEVWGRLSPDQRVAVAKRVMLEPPETLRRQMPPTLEQGQALNRTYFLFG